MAYMAKAQRKKLKEKTQLDYCNIYSEQIFKLCDWFCHKNHKYDYRIEFQDCIQECYLKLLELYPRVLDNLPDKPLQLPRYTLKALYFHLSRYADKQYKSTVTAPKLQ